MVSKILGPILFVSALSLCGCSHTSQPAATDATVAAAKAQQNTQSNIQAVQNNPHLSEAQKAAIIAHLNNPKPTGMR